MKEIVVFLFIIIVSIFAYSEVYGDVGYIQTVCESHGWEVSITGKSCTSTPGYQPLTDDYWIAELVTGLGFPTSIDFIGNNMLILEKNTGKVIRMQDMGNYVFLYDEPVLDVPVRYNYYSGLLGIAALSDRVFLYYTESESGNDAREGKSVSESVDAKNRVYQYDWDGEKLTNPVLIKELVAQLANNHHGGAMTKGLDNEVYFVIGDEGQSGIFENRVENPCYVISFVNTKCSSDVVYETSSIFKIDTDDNNRVELFAMGIRNSFGLGVDPVTGYLWDTENGENYFDEINLVEPRFNSGWNTVMGPTYRENPDTHTCAPGVLNNQPNCEIEYRGFQPVPPPYKNFVYSEPELSWYETVGPTAIAFPDDDFGYSDTLFVGDFHTGTIWAFQLDSDRTGFVFSKPELSDKVFDESASDLYLSDENIFAITIPGGVSDIEFHNGAMYVVSIMNGGIYKIFPKETQISIPDWIKNNANWWASGQIDDDTYVSGLQWLISNGIMKIS